MPYIQLRFAIQLETYESVHRPWAPEGLAFHRWLPDGARDAIELATGHPTSTLFVWTERFGEERIHDNGIIEVSYKLNVRGLSEAGIAMQGRLSSGPLLGRFETFCSSAEAQAVRSQDTGASEYLKLGRRVVRLITTPVRRLIKTLQLDYGQYWLRDVEPWDSRTGSIGSYCRSMQMQATLNGGASWVRFMPDAAMVTFPGLISLIDRSALHLSQGEWLNLPDASREYPLAGAALELVLRAREAEDFRGDWRLAIVETATAAEVAVEEFLKTKPGSRPFVATVLPTFDRLSAEAQFSFLAGTIGEVPREVLLASAPAWRFRHKVVHEGWSPEGGQTEDVRVAIENLQRATAALMGRTFRALSAFEGGSMATPESWDSKSRSAPGAVSA